jgi:Tol biopolymer transport system component
MSDKYKKTAVGDYCEDVFMAENLGGNDQPRYTDGESINAKINTTNRHEAPMSISYDNKLLFLYLSGEKESEDIYISHHKGDTAWTAPKKLQGGVNTPHYEGHAFLAPDMKTLYFSSDKPGGFRGRDIYTATMKEDSTFGDIENCGPRINTEFNEDSPFVYADGSSLYFASEAHGSMGGFDMFYIKYDSAAGDWQEAVNLGYPINTTGDDRFYYVTKNGDWGYFSSARASGENLHDISNKAWDI